jgi:hypothetical protein
MADSVDYAALKQAGDVVDTDKFAPLVKLAVSADGSDALVGLTATTFSDLLTQMTSAASSLSSLLAAQGLHGADAADLLNGHVTLTNTTAADVLAAIGSTVIVATSILVVNKHSTVDTVVEIRDGTTVKIQAMAKANGGGFALAGAKILAGTSGAAITARNVTTGSDVDIFVGGYKVS